MPVKNSNRNTLSSLDGEITDLTTKEILVLKDKLQINETTAELLSTMNALAGKLNSLENNRYIHLLKMLFANGFLYVEFTSDNNSPVIDLATLQLLFGGKKYACTGYYIGTSINPFTFYELDLTAETTNAYKAYYYSQNGLYGSLTFTELSIKTFEDYVR